MAETEPVARSGGLLFPPGAAGTHAAASDEMLRDLALDQIIAALAAGGLPDDLVAVLRTPLLDESGVRHRQAVFAALEDPAVRAILTDLAESVRASAALERRAAAATHELRAARIHLTAVLRYATGLRDVVGRFAALADVPALAASTALTDLFEHLRDVVGSPAFAELERESARLEAGWRSVRFVAWLRSSRVTVAPFDDEPDLSAETAAAFDLFRQADDAAGAVARAEPAFDPVQGSILDAVARLFPQVFDDLRRFRAAGADFVDPAAARFAHELRFFLTYREMLEPLRHAGLPTCIPAVSATERTFSAEAVFDLALAGRLVASGSPVVGNDLSLTGEERILVVSGPNQGGKSTAARAFGQLHHLAAIGCPVPGRAVQVLLPDRVLTHFDREEQLDTLESRLDNDVRRMRDLLDVATGRSVIVLNEIFSSTAAVDAQRLTAEVIRRIDRLDALCMCVTFVDEVAAASAKTVSMVSATDPEDPAVRTFTLERRRADGNAHARSLAAKHGLTADRIDERMRRRAVRA